MADPSTLAASIEALGLSRVACIGDLMLDRFVYGRVERTSPEAPVPILRTDHDDHMLGGAGNVVRNLVSLGAQATLLSVIGDDEVGRRLTGMVGREERVEPHLLVERGRPSTEKTRFVAGGQQLLRTDSETTEAISQRSAESLLGLARDAFAACDVVVLSDYAKGVLTPDLVRQLIEVARSVGRPVVVDPKGRDFGRYAGASVLTPNRAELGFAAGESVATDEAVVAACRSLIARHGLGAILVTRSRDGMTIVSADGRVAHLAAEAREVFDVSGAGDTVVATLAAALGQGADLIAAAQLANAARRRRGRQGGHGGGPCRRPAPRGPRGRPLRIGSKDHAAGCCAGGGRRMARAGGSASASPTVASICFIRATSRCYARRARRRIGSSSASTAMPRCAGSRARGARCRARRHGRRCSLRWRRSIWSSSSPRTRPVRLIEALRPDCLVKGSDYTIDEVVGADIVQGYGGTVLIAENEPGYSTTGTIRRLRG